jgi:hypothetical protein
MAEQLTPVPTAGGAYRFDGLMYPTIPMNGNCENFALKSEFVKRGVEFVKAEYVVIREINGMQMNFDILDFSNSVHGVELEWKGRPGRWVLETGEKVRVSFENGEWIACDLKGNRVPME